MLTKGTSLRFGRNCVKGDVYRPFAFDVCQDDRFAALVTRDAVMFGHTLLSVILYDTRMTVDLIHSFTRSAPTGSMTLVTPAA